MLDILYTIIIYPIVIILEFAFVFAQKLFKETGLSIVFISLTVSILCLPLYAVAEKWQQIERKITNKLKPKIDKIKKAFKGDEQYMILSTYYRQNHYHPIYTLRGSFGLLIQIPFFIAAYSFLSHLEILKGVPFLFIHDLGAPDRLISLGNVTINLLPFVMTLVNCLSSLIYTKGLPAKDKFQLYGMALLFLILLYNSPSALVLYWTMNNIFSVFKNIYYKIQFANKHIVLLGLFSLFCFLISAFCLIKLSYISKAKLLAIILIFAAVLPWLFIIFKNRLSKLINIKFEYKTSLSVFIVSILSILILFGLFIPTQLIVSSPQEFSFIDNYSNPVYFVFNTSLQVFGLFVFWPLCLYFLFSDNIKKYFSLVFFAVCLCILVNVFLFPANYGLISINFIYDINPNHSNTESFINISALLFIFIVSIVLFTFKTKKYLTVFISLCVFSLFSISIINIIKINSEFNKLKTYYVKEKTIINEISPIFSLSKNGKNIVIIMLDRAINGFIPHIFNESPELNEIYSGFILYPNTVSFNGYTAIASPPIFGGYEYIPEEINKRDTTPLVEKHNQSLIMLPRILSENNFKVTVTDPPYANYNWKSDLSIFNDYPDINAYITDAKYTDHWLKENSIHLPDTSEIIKRNMFWYSILKGLPAVLRNPIYMNGNWCSPISGNTLRLTLNGYSVLHYLPLLTEINDDNLNCALVMTNNTTHEGSHLEAPDYKPVITVTNYGKSSFSKEASYHINAAAIKRIGDWIIFLKNNNLYDNTRIILVSDHGPEPNFITKIGLPFNVDQFNPLLMFKDFNSTGSIKTDNTFMSNADVPYLSLIDIIDNPVNPFTGNDISIELKDNPLYIALSGSIHVSGGSTTQYKLDPNKDYYVHTSIFKKENWKRASEK